MTRAAKPFVLRPGLALSVGVIATVALAAWALVAPRTALHGWLIGFATVGSIPLGAVALLATHSLTGGRWGDAARSWLVTAAAATPLILIAFLPLAVFAAAIYPWAADPAAAGPGVAHSYLNTGFFAARGVALLTILSGFALAARRGPLPSLAAGLGLLVYGAGMNLVAFDWLLSLDPHFNSSAFGVEIIVTQLAAALSFVILAGSMPADDPPWSDLGALLLACLLGLLYLLFMTFLIDWYGDLPDQAAWYLRRSRHGWLALEVAGCGLGIVAPLLALLFARVRRRPATLRPVALLALAGVAAQMVWLVAPASGGASAAAGLLGILALGGLAAGLAPCLAAAAPDPGRLAHGR